MFPAKKLYLVSLFSNGLKYSESVVKMLNMTQDVGRQLSTAQNTEAMENLVKSWSQISHAPTNDVKSTSKYPGDSSSVSL